MPIRRGGRSSSPSASLAAGLFRRGLRQLSRELSEITQDIITLKLNLAEDQFIFGKLREVKRDLTEKLTAERERNTELKKKLTQLDLKAVR